MKKNQEFARNKFSIKYSSKFLTHVKKHLGHTGAPANVQQKFFYTGK